MGGCRGWLGSESDVPPFDRRRRRNNDQSDRASDFHLSGCMGTVAESAATPAELWQGHLLSCRPDDTEVFPN